MRVRLAPWGVVESDLVAPPVSRRSADVLTRFGARAHGTEFWVALWVVAAAAEFGAMVPVIFGRAEPVPGWEVVYRMIGGSFAAAGLIAWRRRPDNRSGVLMTVTGFSFFIFPLLSQIDTPVAQTLSMLTDDVWTVPFVALLLTYVTAGRIQSRVDLGLVWLFIFPLLILEFIWMLFLEQDGNILVAFPNEGIADAIDKGQRVLVLAGCIGTSVVVLARWWAASRPGARGGGGPRGRGAGRSCPAWRARSRCCCSPRCSSTTSSGRGRARRCTSGSRSPRWRSCRPRSSRACCAPGSPAAA